MRCVTLLILTVLLTSCASTGDTTGRTPGRLFVAATETEEQDTQELQRDERSRSITHYLTSVIHARTGEYDKAIAELRKAADTVPESSRLQLQLLPIYYQNEDYENAALMAERALRANPENATLHIWLGRIYNQLNRPDDAIAAFKKAIEVDPDGTRGYEALADMEESVNDRVGAADIYERLLEVAPDSAYLHYRLGYNLMLMNDSEGSRIALERALELQPDMAEVSFLLGVVYLDLKEFEKAAQQFRSFLSTNPLHLRGRVNLAAALDQLGDHENALRLITAIVESAQVDTEHHIMRLYLLLRQDSVPDPSIAIAPNGSPLLGTVLQILVRKKAGEPYETLLQTLSRMEGDLDNECTFQLGGLLAAFGNENAGNFLIKKLNGVLKRNTKSRVIETVLGRTYMFASKNQKAKKTFEDVFTNYGGEKWVHYYLATVSEELKEHEQTEFHLNECIKYAPNDPIILNFLGYFYAEQDKNLKEAKRLLDRALTIDPDNGFYLDSLGWIYYRLGDGKRAVEYIERAIRAMNNDDAILRDHMGDAYLLNKQPEKAIAEWKRAIRLDPTAEGIKEKIETYSEEGAE